MNNFLNLNNKIKNIDVLTNQSNQQMIEVTVGLHILSDKVDLTIRDNIKNLIVFIKDGDYQPVVNKLLTSNLKSAQEEINFNNSLQAKIVNLDESLESVEELLTQNTQNLSVLFLTYYNQDKIKEEFGVDLTPDLSKPIAKTLEVVKKGGSLNDKAKLFLKRNGEIFTDPVTKLNGQFVTKEALQPLKTKEFQNYKINDLSFKNIDKLLVNFINALTDKKIKNNIEAVAIRDVRSPIVRSFSSRDSQENVKAIILVDEERFVADHARFNPISKSSKQEIINQTRIKQIRVIRSRDDIDNSYSDELLIQTGDSSDGTLKPFERTRRDKLSSIEESIQFNNTIKSVLFVDKSLKRKTVGHYKYKIEVDLLDGSLTYYKDLTKRINLFIQKMNRLINLISPFLNKRNKIQKSFVNNLSNLGLLEEIRVDFNYIVSQLDIDIDAQKVNAFFEPSRISMNILELLLNKFNVIHNTIKNLTGISFSQYGNDDSSYTDDYSFTHIDSKIYNADKKNIINVDYVFDEEEDDSNVVLDNTQIFNRLNKETLKYYNQNSGSLDYEANGNRYFQSTRIEDQKASFLSPSKISLRGKSINLLKGDQNTWEAKKYNNMIKDYLNPEQKKNPIPQILQDSGVSIQNYKVFAKDNVLKINEKQINFKDVFGDEFEQLIPSNNIFGDEELKNFTQLMEKSDENSSNSLVFSMLPDLLEDDSFTNNEVDFDLNSVDNLIDKKGISKEKISQAPNQIKSLYLGASGDKKVKSNGIVAENQQTNIDQTNKAMFHFNFNMIGALEYVEGFEEDEQGVPLLSSPIWKKLNERVVKESNQPYLFCRVRRENNNYFSTSLDSVFNYEFKNEFFFIRPERLIIEDDDANISNVPRVNFDVSLLNTGIL